MNGCSLKRAMSRIARHRGERVKEDRPSRVMPMRGHELGYEILRDSLYRNPAASVRRRSCSVAS